MKFSVFAVGYCVPFDVDKADEAEQVNKLTNW